MNKRLLVFVLVVLLALSACAPATRSNENQASGGMGAMPEEAPAAPAAEPPMVARDGGVMPEMEIIGSDSSAQQDANRIVIRNASLTIVVVDPGQAMTAISRMADEMGGFTVNSNLYKTYKENNAEVPEANITVRVPASRLNEALDRIKGLVQDPVNDVKSENVSGQDVTREYTDLRSRLTNLEEAEKQLREIMASAVKTEDVLAVHAQLTQIRSEIEIIKGQIQYYEEASSLSAISVQILAQAGTQPLQVGGWRPAGVAREAVQTLIDTMQFLAGAIIWLVIYILPTLLVILLPLWLVVTLIRRARKPKAQPPSPVEP